MPKAYSMDLRKRVIEACDEGQTIAQVAERFRVSTSFVEKLQQRRRESGTLAPKPHGGGRQPRLSPEHDQWLRALLAAQPDTTQAELREKQGVKVHLSSLWYCLQRLGLTFKKTLAAAEQAREDVRLQRDAWQKTQPTLDRPVWYSLMRPGLILQWCAATAGENADNGSAVHLRRDIGTRARS